MKEALYWALVNGDKVLLWVLVALGGLLSAWVLKQMKAGTVRDIVGRALGAVGTAVLEVGQTYVAGLKAAGKFTPEAQDAAKQMAIGAAKSYVGAKGLKVLAKVLGLEVDKWFAAQTEAAVATLKATSEKSGALPLPLPPLTP
jgi:hypothetical protein